jgi:hypothetical protein
MNHETQADYRRARELRRLLADVYGAAPAGAVFLAPGTLVGLRLIFDALRVRRVALSAGEYFDRGSFPGRKVDLVRPAALPDHVVHRRCDAVVVSVVTWRGERLPVDSLFREIRRRLGTRAPLLVADFAHAGAAGFPRVGETLAHLVVGDAAKWITPPDWPDRLAFLWFRTPGLRLLAKRVFAPFYLAGPRPGATLEARWVDPHAVAEVTAWQRRHRVRRAGLLRRHRADLKLATKVADRCGVPAPTSSLVWIASAAAAQRLPPSLRSTSLLWRLPGGGARVMCRSDRSGLIGRA